MKNLAQDCRWNSSNYSVWKLGSIVSISAQIDMCWSASEFLCNAFCCLPGFHAVDLDSATVNDLYVPSQVRGRVLVWLTLGIFEGRECWWWRMGWSRHLDFESAIIAQHGEYKGSFHSSYSRVLNVCICPDVNCAQGKWSLHSRWNFSPTFTSMATNADQLEWRQTRNSALSVEVRVGMRELSWAKIERSCWIQTLPSWVDPYSRPVSQLGFKWQLLRIFEKNRPINRATLFILPASDGIPATCHHPSFTYVVWLLLNFSSCPESPSQRYIYRFVSWKPTSFPGSFVCRFRTGDERASEQVA